MKRTGLKRSRGWGEGAFLSTSAGVFHGTSRGLSHISMSLLVLVFVIGPVVAHAEQYTAYSLKVAQQRVREAGDNWRQREPEVTNLAGINKVEGFVFDSTASDLILVGQREEGRAVLTLDDLVVALRARFRYNEWPLVSIDSTPDTEKTQMQHVRFEGGIQDTAFGQAMFDADYRLKEMGMGLQSRGVGSLRTYWDRSVEEMDSGTRAGERSINSRFWFYPINPHVVVREGICVVRGLKVGVFTEVMGAKIDGQRVEDLKNVKDQAGDAFATDVSQRFDELCRTQPPFNCLRGLQELVAVSKALEDLEERPDLSYWLERFVVAQKPTPHDVEVLRRRYKGKRGLFEVSGGVHLTALAMRLNAGDVTALREAVLKMRPSLRSLKWEFLAADWLVSLEPGQAGFVDIVPLYTHAVFLERNKRYDASIEGFNDILAIDPLNVTCYCWRGVAFLEKGQPEQALKDFNKALEVSPLDEHAACLKGDALALLGRHEEAMTVFEKALEKNPYKATLWGDKGSTLWEAHKYTDALECYDRAIKLDATNPTFWRQKGRALARLRKYPEAIVCFDQALHVQPSDGWAWYYRGEVFQRIGKFKEAVDCFEKATPFVPAVVQEQCVRHIQLLGGQ
jgi:tetratricopeptide (TPR) repeat protein